MESIEAAPAEEDRRQLGARARASARNSSPPAPAATDRRGSTAAPFARDDRHFGASARGDITAGRSGLDHDHRDARRDQPIGLDELRTLQGRRDRSQQHWATQRGRRNGSRRRHDPRSCFRGRQGTRRDRTASRNASGSSGQVRRCSTRAAHLEVKRHRGGGAGAARAKAERRSTGRFRASSGSISTRPAGTTSSTCQTLLTTKRSPGMCGRANMPTNCR